MSVNQKPDELDVLLLDLREHLARVGLLVLDCCHSVAFSLSSDRRWQPAPAGISSPAT